MNGRIDAEISYLKFELARSTPAANAPSAQTMRPLEAPAAARSDRDYGAVPAGPFVFGTPLLGPPRATVRRELVPGRIWSFEQVQGLIFVHVPVRMTVIALDGGGLLVYAPIAPTAECLRLLAEVEASAGPVRHVLLPSLALEHLSLIHISEPTRPY